MRETLVTLTRKGVTIGQHLTVQVDQASTREVAIHRQVYDYRGVDLFKVYTLGWYPYALVQRQDVLLDERYTDPDSGAAFKYRVVGRVKDFERDHQECFCEVVVGG